MSDISPETIASAIARLAESDVIAIVHRNLPKWRAWFPSEQSSVETARADLLALVTLAEAYLEIERSTVAALNLLGEVARQLPNDWSIELRITNDEIDLTLENPDGDAVEVHSDDGCHFRTAIDTALRAESMEGGDE